MSDNERLEELRRRVARDPASIAFAHLAEEYRRCGRYDEAVETCQTGLAHHPGYLSARVTLSRALMELGRFDEAQEELEIVLAAAPENLAAVRTASEIQRRRGDEAGAGAAASPSAQAAVRDQEELEQLVRAMARKLDSTPPPITAPLPPAGSDGHQRGAPPPDLFVMFGKALNADTDSFRDTAREEFFAGLDQEASAAAGSPSSSHPTLALGPPAATVAVGDQLADLTFRDSDEQVGLASAAFRPQTEATTGELGVSSPPTRLASGSPLVASSSPLVASSSPLVASGFSRKKGDEAAKLLVVLEQWLVALESSRSSTQLGASPSTSR